MFPILFPLKCHLFTKLVTTEMGFFLRIECFGIHYGIHWKPPWLPCRLPLKCSNIFLQITKNWWGPKSYLRSLIGKTAWKQQKLKRISHNCCKTCLIILRGILSQDIQKSACADQRRISAPLILNSRKGKIVVGWVVDNIWPVHHC